MIEIVGRLLVREGRVVGLYIPLKGTPLNSGIYEIRRIMGELELVYIGTPAMPNGRYQNVGVEELVGDATAGMTKGEWDSVKEGKQETFTNEFLNYPPEDKKSGHEEFQ